MLRREALSVVAVERGGRLPAPARCAAAASTRARPGQFFMLGAPKRVLPRPMSVCAAPPGELWFLIDAIGPGTRALCALEARGRAARLRAARQRLPPRRRAAARWSAAGSGSRRLPYLSEALGHPPAVLGFRSERHAEAAALVPRRRGGDRPDARHGRDAGGLRRPRLRAGADARGRARARAATRSSPGRRRWPAGTAPATAAWSRSTASSAALRRRPGAACCLTPPAAWTRSPPRRSCGRARRVRDQDRHARAAGGQRARADRRDGLRDAQLDRAPEPGHRRLPRLDAAAAGGARLPIWVSVGGGSAPRSTRELCSRPRPPRRRRRRSSSTCRARTSPRRRATRPRSSLPRAPRPTGRSTRSSRPPCPDSAPSRAPRRRRARTACRSSTPCAGSRSTSGRSGRGSGSEIGGYSGPGAEADRPRRRLRVLPGDGAADRRHGRRHDRPRRARVPRRRGGSGRARARCCSPIRRRRARVRRELDEELRETRNFVACSGNRARPRSPTVAGLELRRR